MRFFPMTRAANPAVIRQSVQEHAGGIDKFTNPKKMGLR